MFFHAGRIFFPKRRKKRTASTNIGLFKKRDKSVEFISKLIVPRQYKCIPYLLYIQNAAKRFTRVASTFFPDRDGGNELIIE